jgi:RHS repeat-associated protein
MTTTNYAYDANGNRTVATGSGGTQNGVYNAQDRLLSYGSETFTYTPNGELLTRSTQAGTTTYQIDALSNLVAITLPGGKQVTYLVDGLNRRIGKKVNGSLVQGFLYQDGLRPIAELDGSGNLVSRFVYAGDNSTPDYMIKNGVTYRIISDQVGSPRLVVNTGAGQVIQRMDYDAFGNLTADTNPGFQPFGFAGGLYDQDTKLVHFGAREYDGKTGRWISKDPILFESGQTNLYVYVENDPVNQTDPEGLGPRKKLGKIIDVPQPQKPPKKPQHDTKKCPIPHSPDDPIPLVQNFTAEQVAAHRAAGYR